VSCGLVPVDQFSLNIDKALPKTVCGEPDTIEKVFYILAGRLAGEDRLIRLALRPGRTTDDEQWVHARFRVEPINGATIAEDLAAGAVEHSTVSSELDRMQSAVRSYTRGPVQFVVCDLRFEPAPAVDTTQEVEERKPPFGFEDLVADMQDPHLAFELVCGYLRDAERRLESLHQSLHCHDLVTAHRDAHSIRGSALNIHAWQLADAAGELETVLQDGHVRGAGEKLRRIKCEHEIAYSFLSNLNPDDFES
jgi:HPt (histidine-containing phosphotransfer) domain-containing protein